MIRTSDNAKELYCALGAAQAEIPTIARDSVADVPTRTGGKYSYTFASLAGILAAVRPVLAKHGLALTHGVAIDGSKVAVTTRLVHGASGGWIETDVAADAAASSPQAIGSVITYCRRYGVSALLALATEDDDGEAGEGRAQTAHAKTVARVVFGQPARSVAPSAPQPQAQAGASSTRPLADYVVHIPKTGKMRLSQATIGQVKAYIAWQESERDAGRWKPEYEKRNAEMLEVARQWRDYMTASEAAQQPVSAPPQAPAAVDDVPPPGDDDLPF